MEGSLKRLRLERIDLYQLHIPDPATSFDKSMETLAELRDQGKIRLIGLSNVTREHVERRGRLRQLSRCIIVTASPIGSGSMYWTIVNRTGLRLPMVSLGCGQSRWRRAGAGRKDA